MTTSSTSNSWLESIVGHELRRGDDVVPTSDCAGKHVALYFSAHWCPPCKRFTPRLVSAYKQLQQAGKAFEIIYVSLDKSPEQLKEYFATMPWLAVPPANGDLLSALPGKYGVLGVPTLIVFSPEGEVLTRSGVAAVSDDPTCQRFPWEGAKTGVLEMVMSKLPMLILGLLFYFAFKFMFKKGGPLRPYAPVEQLDQDADDAF